MSSARPEHLPAGYPQVSSGSQGRSVSPKTSSPSPVEASTPNTSALRTPFGIQGTLNPAGKMAGAARSGTGSPSHEMPGSGRLYSKRAREIQAQEGVSGMPVNPWHGPPTSGNSTPLRENIPESPTDGFPEFPQLPTPESLGPTTRRARAGTVPSRFPPGLGNGFLNVPGLNSQSSRATPSQSPFNKSPSPGVSESSDPSKSSTLLQRLRAGSMPQRSPFSALPGTSSPFGPSIFSSWNPTGRERGNTLASIASVGSNGPSSPAHSALSRDTNGDNDVHMRTLDYLGLAETPQPTNAQLATPYLPGLADFTKQANRFRSYSVNNKDKYADEEEDDYDYAALLQDQLAATNAAIHSHNLAVQGLQAFATQTMTRPRARTAGVLDLTGAGSRGMRSYYPTPSRLDNSINAADMHLPEEKSYEDLPQAVAAMNLGRSNSRNNGMLQTEEGSLEGPTSALWLGSIPTSTTTSTLTEMFKQYGPIISARVLTHKNCGFVNFERVDSAIAAKASMNGKEIFPGAGPIRINFAKPPSASNTPGHDSAFPSPSPDPFGKGHEGGSAAPGSSNDTGMATAAQASNAAPTIPPLSEMTADILKIVKSFGATEEDGFKISHSLTSAIQYDAFIDEIPPIREPTHTRVHDAPKLRDIRKRIDNQSLSKAEIESIAVDMLPEIAELSSDYLGNTVVQKLFEHCSDEIRDMMLAEIAPHMAEIGVHKNGTWAAQKIIDVCKTPHQMSLIVENLRPYTIPLFLDQYGNYVLQGCLKFCSPYNDFIFETMLSKMWEIGQGRYGARAMRACLESHHASKEQQRMLAAAIALHSVQLATNANGALLLTWFLDTCTFPQRRSVLAPQLVPYLVHLCTHKVAYLTVLKVINQKAEADARDTILKALFFTPNDQVLEAILSDHACGATLIFKVLTTPFFDESIRGQVVENVKNVLVRIKAQPNQGYKRLMDEVGLSTRNGGGSTSRDHAAANNAPNERSRPASRQTHAQTHATAQQNAQYGNQYMNPLNPAGGPGNYDMGYAMPRSDSVEPPMAPFPQYGQQGPMYNPTSSPMVPNMQQLQYQQNLLQRGTPPMPGYFPPMQAGYGGFNSPSPSIDQYRNQNMANGSPIQAPGAPAGFAPPAFVAMIEDVFHQRADPETIQEFNRLVHEKKKDGKKENKGCYYFVPPSTNSRFTPRKARPAPYKNLLTMDFTPAKRPTHGKDADGHVSKKAKLEAGSANGVNGEGHTEIVVRKSAKGRKGRSGSVSSESSLSSVPDDMPDDYEEFMDQVDDDLAVSRPSSSAAEPNDAPAPAASTQPIRGSQKKPGSKKKNVSPRPDPSPNATQPSHPQDSDMPAAVVANGAASHNHHHQTHSGPKFSSKFGNPHDLDRITKLKLSNKADNSRVTKLHSAQSSVRKPLEAEPEPAGDKKVRSDHLRPSRTPVPALTLRAARAAKRNREDVDDALSPSVALSRAEFEPASRRSSRAGTPSSNLRSHKKPRAGLRVKNSPMKKKGTSAGIPRGSGERSSPIANGLFNDKDDNDDSCYTCGGNGELVCCDGCNYSFHFLCIDPPMDEGHMPDEWFCNECMHRLFPAQFVGHKGAFSSLLDALDKKNSRAFRLPQDIRNYFEGVRTGPEGEYEEIPNAKPRSTRRGYEEPFDFFKVRNPDGTAALCHKCHHGATDNQPLIPCSVCGLNWHLECLDPPLAIPPVLRTWKCPCHIDDALTQKLAPAHKYRKIKGAPVIEQAYSRGLANNGCIEVEEEDDDDVEEPPQDYGRVYRIPERGIKLDFVSRVHHKRQLRAEMRSSPYYNRKVPAPPRVPSVEDQQAALNLSQLARGADSMDRLVSALLSQANPAVVALMAQGDAARIANGTLNQADTTALEGMLAQLDSLKGGITKILQTRDSATQNHGLATPENDGEIKAKHEDFTMNMD